MCNKITGIELEAFGDMVATTLMEQKLGYRSDAVNFRTAVDVTAKLLAKNHPCFLEDERLTIEDVQNQYLAMFELKRNLQPEV